MEFLKLLLLLEVSMLEIGLGLLGGIAVYGLAHLF